jgi:hypothetical protein
MRSTKQTHRLTGCSPARTAGRGAATSSACGTGLIGLVLHQRPHQHVGVRRDLHGLRSPLGSPAHPAELAFCSSCKLVLLLLRPASNLMKPLIVPVACSAWSSKRPPGSVMQLVASAWPKTA